MCSLIVDLSYNDNILNKDTLLSLQTSQTILSLLQSECFDFMNSIIEMRPLELSLDVMNTYEIEIFVFNSLQSIKIDRSFDSLQDAMNSSYLVSLSYLLIDDAHNKEVDLDRVYKV